MSSLDDGPPPSKRLATSRRDMNAISKMDVQPEIPLQHHFLRIALLSEDGPDAVDAHKRLLDLIGRSDPYLRIFDSNDNPVDADQFPDNNEKHALMFPPGRDGPNMIIVHRIEGGIPFSRFKADIRGLPRFFSENKVWLRSQPTPDLHIVSIGFVSHAHPIETNRDQFQERLVEIIEGNLTDGESKTLEYQLGWRDSPTTTVFAIVRPSKNIGIGRKDERVSTSGLEILVPKNHADTYKTILARLEANSLFPLGKWIPYAIVSSGGAEIFRNIIFEQNRYLEDTVVVTILGLNDRLLELPIDVNSGPARTTIDVRTLIESHEFISSCERAPTSRADFKLAVLCDKGHQSSVEDWLQIQLDMLVKQELVVGSYRTPGFYPPRVIKTGATGETEKTYLASLADLYKTAPSEKKTVAPTRFQSRYKRTHGKDAPNKLASYSEVARPTATNFSNIEAMDTIRAELEQKMSDNMEQYRKDTDEQFCTIRAEMKDQRKELEQEITNAAIQHSSDLKSGFESMMKQFALLTPATDPAPGRNAGRGNRGGAPPYAGGAAKK